MKGYKKYMDEINVDPSLHEKIMNRITTKTAPQKRNRHIYRFAGIAACMALLLFGVWAVPNLFNGETADPNFVLHALTFNEVESSMSAGRITPDGYFDYDLTDEQLNAVFPNLGLSLSASAHYRDDGTLWFVVASEYEWDGARRSFTWTTIHLGNEGILPDSTLLFPKDNPIVSDVHSVSVTAFVYGVNNEYFRADFVLNGVAYRVETSDISVVNTGVGKRDGMERLTELVNKIIVNGSADLTVLANPVIPELRNDRLTLAEAQLEAEFGAFLPQNIPTGFIFESASRIVDTRNNILFVSWSNGLDFISWRVRTPLESDLLNIVSTHDRAKYDVSLYTIPWFGSVPMEYHNYFQSPVFLADEFTLDVITARTRLVENGRMGTASRWETTQFGVLFGDVLVEVSMTGVSPEEIWEMMVYSTK